jgi:serine/threonine protein kinase
MLILMELCEGGFTLINMINYCQNKVPEHVILNIMRDVCLGVKHMHGKGIAHRDLKVENILLKN